MLILASRSAARRAMLDAVGLRHIAEPAPFDEFLAKRAAAAAGDSPEGLAACLARGKALASAARHPDALVIGADQILVTEDGQLPDQPGSIAGVIATLELLSGKRHRLISTAALARGGEILWEGSETARLTMRPLTAGQIRAYVEREGYHVLGCVGAYRFEGPGAALFESVEGSHGAILGLPLLPLLAALRTHGVDPIDGHD